MAYDPLGRLRQTTASSVATDFVYDGDALSAEYVGANVARRYVHGPGIDEPIVWYEGANLSDRRYLITDHQGSVIASNGASATTRYAYGPYGEPSNWSGSRFRYTGQAALPEAQLYHYKARVYDPMLGRFLQTDPIGYEDGLNLYQYAFDEPMGFVDPTGLEVSVIVINQGALIIGGEHVAIYVHPRNGRPGVLYDPGGSFRPSSDMERGSTAYFEESGGQNFLREFVQYETRNDQRVTITTVRTNAATEARILSNMGGIDGPLDADGNHMGDPGPLFCANYCAAALSGEGPFSERGTMLPGDVADMAADAARIVGGFRDRYERDRQTNQVQGQTLRTWRGQCASGSNSVQCGGLAGIWH